MKNTINNLISDTDHEVLSSELKKLLLTQDRFYFFLAHTPDFIYFKNSKHEFTYASQAFANLTQHRDWKELRGKTDFDIFPKEHASVYFKMEEDVIKKGQSLTEIEEPYYDLNGNVRWVSSSKRPIYDESGDIVGLFGISRDITRIKELENELKKQAYFDVLTHLPNRNYLFQHADNILERAEQEARDVYVYFIDLDGFKQVNDLMGHKTGDCVLQVAAQRLRKHFGDVGHVSRIGGDEFIGMALSNDDFERKVGIANNVIESLNEPILVDGKSIHVGCSIGISTYPQHGTDISHLILMADKAMYRAKNAGKNTFRSI
ncbi:putative GGDEF and PAS domains protein [Vibrio nigripulchritudo SOn1]|uniref:GGDEF and PAS domains protein n=1 Tax=Vibrio nigripulchritudo SOn1 TaxID=1238450 RepID=A0AAV2VYD3_9VIBR|nr:GGDEF domain-containing protein [Vibrio nigripulchritudo]CCO49688.1 putative GGDEF and PAS domains protein [Vibrio nigripulchritudo SOn1]